jgi:dipicolinate synthase subunit A
MRPEALAREAEARGMIVFDYYNSEKVRQRNGELAAEGAISIAMQELPIAMDEVKAAVVGCGRIGTSLCKKLRAMGASVTAVSRSSSSLVEAEQCGCTVKQMNDDVLRGLLRGYDVVFTTVPHRVFHSEILRSYAPLACGRGTLFVDLSSSPGSFDAASVRENGLHLLWALSLPGKYAPDSAGAVLAEQMLALLSMSTEQKEELK